MLNSSKRPRTAFATAIHAFVRCNLYQLSALLFFLLTSLQEVNYEQITWLYGVSWLSLIYTGFIFAIIASSISSDNLILSAHIRFMMICFYILSSLLFLIGGHEFSELFRWIIYGTAAILIVEYIVFAAFRQFRPSNQYESVSG